MKLYFKTFGEGRPLMILHGLFGSSDNWLSHAKEFAQHFKVYLIDLRNHGRSPHSNDFSYDAMAEDLLELIADENLRDVLLVGHSMGGKTILRFAQSHSFLIERMIVADMGVKSYKPHHDEIFKGLFAVDVENCANRKEAEERLSAFVAEESTRQFLLKNIYWKEQGKLAWRFNLQSLFDNRGEIILPLPDVQIETPTLFIRGELSNYIRETDFESILELVPQATFRTIDKTGHWVHAEAPETFRKMVHDYLR